MSGQPPGPGRLHRAQAFELDLHLELGQTRPARALERALRDAIVTGRVPAGHRLPPTRSLAADLGIARATVAEVYAQLTAEGWLEARTGAGTWVTAATAALPSPSPAGPASGTAPGAAESLAGSGPARPLRLYGGLPDPSLFPRREWLAAARRAVDAATIADLGYGQARGAPRLRGQLAAYLRRTRGVDAGADRVVIGHGFGGLLALACRALAAGGARRLAVEEYGHPEHRDIIGAAGLEVVPLPVDDEGADVSRLGAEVGAVLVTASHQFPTGAPLSPARRRAAVAWAKATGGLIIEDDYDGEFRYDRRAVGALQGIAADEVMYIGTASKALAPAVGLAWAIVPGRLLGPLLDQRSELDLPRDVINQLTLAEFLDVHAYDRHVRRMRGEYRQRREHLAALLSARVPAACLTGLPAGLQAVVMLPAGASAALVVAEGLRRGIAFRALGGYAADPRGAHPEAVVLGFGASPASRAAADIELAVDAIQAGVASVGHTVPA